MPKINLLNILEINKFFDSGQFRILIFKKFIHENKPEANPREFNGLKIDHVVKNQKSLVHYRLKFVGVYSRWLGGAGELLRKF